MLLSMDELYRIECWMTMTAHVFVPLMCSTMDGVLSVLCKWKVICTGVCKLCRPTEVLLHSTQAWQSVPVEVTTTPNIPCLLKTLNREVNSCRWACLSLYENAIALFGWSSFVSLQISADVGAKKRQKHHEITISELGGKRDKDL